MPPRWNAPLPDKLLAKQTQGATVKSGLVLVVAGAVAALVSHEADWSALVLSRIPLPIPAQALVLAVDAVALLIIATGLRIVAVKCMRARQDRAPPSDSDARRRAAKLPPSGRSSSSLLSAEKLRQRKPGSLTPGETPMTKGDRMASPGGASPLPARGYGSPMQQPSPGGAPSPYGAAASPYGRGGAGAIAGMYQAALFGSAQGSPGYRSPYGGGGGYTSPAAGAGGYGSPGGAAFGGSGAAFGGAGRGTPRLEPQLWP